MSWIPTTDFEDEIVSLQPEYNFIYGDLSAYTPQPFYPRPQSHLDYANKQKLKKEKEKSLKQTKSHNAAISGHSQVLSVIAKIQKIAGTKSAGEQPTLDDWNNNDHLEKETVAMMRNCGLGPSIEKPLNEKATISTLPISDKMYVMHNGRKKLPIFFGEQYFKLEPKVSSSSTSGVDSGDSESNFMYSTPITSVVNDDDNVTGTASYVVSSDSSISNEGQHLQSLNIQESCEPLDCENSNSSSQFKSAIDNLEDLNDSYSTANSDSNVIKTQSWYQRRHHKPLNTSTVCDESSYSSSNSSNYNSGIVFKYYSKDNLKPKQTYTAKELYEMKRNIRP